MDRESRHRVIKPDAGGIQVSRIRAQRWRKRPGQAVMPMTDGRRSALQRVVSAARIALAPYSTPESARLTQTGRR